MPLGRMLRHLDKALGALVADGEGEGDLERKAAKGSARGEEESMPTNAPGCAGTEPAPAVGARVLGSRASGPSRFPSFATFRDETADDEPMTDPCGPGRSHATRCPSDGGTRPRDRAAEPVPLVRASEGPRARDPESAGECGPAIPEGAPDQHEIRVRVREIPPGSSAHTADRSAGEVLVEVEDTGCGMAPELVSQIFEPFLHDQARRHEHRARLDDLTGHRGVSGGFISASSQLGKGSIFGVHLPIYRAGREE